MGEVFVCTAVEKSIETSLAMERQLRAAGRERERESDIWYIIVFHVVIWRDGTKEGYFDVCMVFSR